MISSFMIWTNDFCALLKLLIAAAAGIIKKSTANIPIWFALNQLPVHLLSFSISILLFNKNGLPSTVSSSFFSLLLDLWWVHQPHYSANYAHRMLTAWLEVKMTKSYCFRVETPKSVDYYRNTHFFQPWNITTSLIKDTRSHPGRLLLSTRRISNGNRSITSIRYEI